MYVPPLTCVGLCVPTFVTCCLTYDPVSLVWAAEGNFISGAFDAGINNGTELEANKCS